MVLRKLIEIDEYCVLEFTLPWQVEQRDMDLLSCVPTSGDSSVVKSSLCSSVMY